MKKVIVTLISLVSITSIAYAWQLGNNYDLNGAINVSGEVNQISGNYINDSSCELFASSSSAGTTDDNAGFLPTVNNLPSVVITTPLDGLVTDYTRPTFRWEYTDADSHPQSGFLVELSTTENFSVISASSTNTTSANPYWTPTNDLALNDYWWRVKVRDNPWDEWSVYSSTRQLTITILNTPPNPPQALTQLVGTNNDLGLSWNTWTNDTSIRLKFTLDDPDTADNVRYHLQISTTYGSFSPQYLVINSTLPASGWLSEGTTWYDASLTLQTSYWWRVRCIDDDNTSSPYSSGTITAGQMHFALDSISPSKIDTLVAATGYAPGEIDLAWTSPGDDNITGKITNGAYKIRYSTYALSSPSFWTDSEINWTNFSNKYQITVPTTTHTSIPQTRTLTGLRYNVTYYIRVWTRDEIGVEESSWIGNWSPISIGATTWAQIPIYGVEISTDSLSFGGLKVSSSVISAQTITVTNIGNIKTTFALKISSTPLWGVHKSNPDNDIFSLQAMFNDVKPSLGSFSGTLHGVTTSYQDSGTGGGEFAGNQTGKDVAASDERNLWCLIKTPLSTSTTAQQDITFYINANP